MRILALSAALIALSTAGAFAQDNNLRRDQAVPEQVPAIQEPVQDNDMVRDDAMAPAANREDDDLRPLDPAAPPAMEAQNQPPAADLTPAPVMLQWVAVQQPDEWLSSKIIGAGVFNAAADHLGDISELVLDRNGEVKAVIIGVGGFLGIGRKDVGVPFASITNVPDEDGNPHLVLNVTTEALNDAPAYLRLEDQDAAQGVAIDVTVDRDGDGVPADRDVDDNDPARQ